MRSTMTRERLRSHSDNRRRLRRLPTASKARAQRVMNPQVTLDEVIRGAFDRLVGLGTATCPVCQDEAMTPTGCPTCGSRLS